MGYSIIIKYFIIIKYNFYFWFIINRNKNKYKDIKALLKKYIIIKRFINKIKYNIRYSEIYKFFN